MSDLCVGKILKSNAFGSFEVLEIKGYYHVKIKFLSTGYVSFFRKDHVLRGAVKDPYYPNVFGVGFVGVGEFKAHENGNDTKAYTVWHAMLSRCYSEYTQKKQPTYIGCTVVKEWHNFQKFAPWFYQNYPNDGNAYHLDKDIRIAGNRIYSPNACSFVTKKENNANAQAKHYVIRSPDGKTHDILNLKRFCEANNLSYKALHNVVKGKSTNHKGWTNAQ